MLNLLQYSLVSLIVFLGLVVGFVMAISAKEELKPGKKYFIILQQVVLFLIIILISYSYLNLYLTILIAVLSIVLFSLFLKYKIGVKEYILYPLLGIVFYLSSRNINLFMVESGLMFIYGLPTGSLLTNIKDKKGSIIRILYSISFILIALVLFILF